MTAVKIAALAVFIAAAQAAYIPSEPRADASVNGWYSQCGGINHSGSTACADKSTCIILNPYYYQCMPNQYLPAGYTAASGPSASSCDAIVTVTVTVPPAGSTTKASSAAVTTTKAANPVTSPVVSTTAVVSTSARVSSSAAPVSSSIKTTSALSTSSVVPTTSAKPTTTSVATTSTKTSTSAAAATTTPVSSGGSLPFLGGVNLAGFDFSVYTDGSFSGNGIDPPVSQIAHFASQGVNAFRIPFGWQLATPTLGGTIDSGFLARYDAIVKTALAASTQPYVILDLHNYGRWNGGIVGQGGPTNAQFASVWTQLAAHYKSEPRVIFGIMNEPHDIPNLSTWAGSVQAAVNAIRAAGATSQYILIPGSTWSHASALINEAGPSLLQVTDPAGGVNKLVFDVHEYLDSNGSGQSRECTTDNVGVFATLVNWLKINGRQALLTETGGGNTASCQSKLKTQLAFIKANAAQTAGFTVWSAGSFDASYELTVTPGADGSDNALWTSAVKPNLA